MKVPGNFLDLCGPWTPPPELTWPPSTWSGGSAPSRTPVTQALSQDGTPGAGPRKAWEELEKLAALCETDRTAVGDSVVRAATAPPPLEPLQALVWPLHPQGGGQGDGLELGIHYTRDMSSN